MTSASDADSGRKRSELLELISAVAAGDASREDVARELRRSNVDALDMMIEVFAEQERAAVRRRTLRGERLDVQSFATRKSQVAPKPHRVPQLPILLRGTLYDPQDITRFDGTELHYIATNQGYILAIDDRALIENWWQMSYLNSVASANRILPNTTDPTIIAVTTTNTGRPGGFGTVRPSTVNFNPFTPSGWTYAVGVIPPPVPHTNFYEHINRGGDRLELDYIEGGMSDLRDHDFNDKISSIEMVRTTFVRLHEHANFQGESVTLLSNVDDLGLYGWNDVASSVETHGATPDWGHIAIGSVPIP